MRLFNEKEGKIWLIKEFGLDYQFIENLHLLGISSIANLMGAIKIAKYYEMNENDIIFTVATDSMQMYQSRIREEREKYGTYSYTKAEICYKTDLAELRLDNMLELSYYDKRRMHNLKYFTWIEQQGKSVEELDAQWYDDNYWKREYAKADEFDEEIIKFNKKTGLLKNL